MAEMLGYSVEEILEKSPLDFLDEEWRKEILRLRREILQRDFTEGELKFRRKDGSALWTRYNSCPIFNDKGEHVATFAMHTDITEHKRAENKLRYLASLVETVSDAIISTDKDLIIRSWNKAAERVYGWRAEEVIGVKGSDLLQTAFPKGVTRGSITQAIFEQGSWEGELIQKTKAGDAITVQAKSVVLKDEAGHVTGGVSISHDVTERKRAEEQLERSNQRVSQILTSIQEDFYVVDRNWTFVYANERFTSKLGKQPEDLVGRNLWEMFPRHVGTVLGENFRAAMEKRQIRRFEMGGEYTDAWYSVAVYPSEEGITVLGSDITEQKRAEARAALLASFPEMNPNPVIEVNAQGLVTYANRAASTILKDLGQDVRLLLPLDMDNLLQSLGQNEGPESYYRERTIGNLILGEDIHVLKDLGVMRIYGMDITAKKRAEEALKESEERLKSVLANSRDVIYRFNMQTDKFEYISQSAEEVVGYAAEELVALDRESALSMIHPDDLPRMRAALETLEGNGRATAEYRQRTKDGTYRWLSNHMALMRGDTGKPLYRTGNIRDITERKRDEAALKASEENLHLMVNEGSDAMAVLDADGMIQAVSRLGAELLGYEEGELIGKHAQDFAATFSRLEVALKLEDLRLHGQRVVTTSMYVKNKAGAAQMLSLHVRVVYPGTKAEKYLLKFNKVDLPFNASR